ncbi:IGP family C-type lectin domain containing protein, putative [Leishmania lindenbergi]|uniref:IGP family C-type lectin domain containing protein n=1 Tax=Leishmania lindenbergi TaxID=651832 RepID=A0AAW3A963_9TRYP
MFMSSRERYSRSVQRGLLCVCALALLRCVLLTDAAAPVYDATAVQILVVNTFDSSLRSSQVQVCATMGGVLVPDVSDAIHLELLNKMEEVGVTSYCGYLGGSTLLSSTGCTTSKATLDCIWYWDQGRYNGIENAYPFYKGNSYPASGSNGGLSGAGMISTASDNYWTRKDGIQTFPGKKYQRYAMLTLPQTYSRAGWVDSSDTSFSYGEVPTNSYFAMCLVELVTTTTTTSTTTTTAEPPATTTTTMNPTTTTTTQPSNTSTTNGPAEKKESNQNVTMWVGISIFIVLVAGLASVLILCKAREKGWCCYAPKESVVAMSVASGASVDPAASQRANPRVSRPSNLSLNSSISSSSCCGTVRSFHAATPNKDGSGRRSILRNDYEEMEGYPKLHDPRSNTRSTYSSTREEFDSSAEQDTMLLPGPVLSSVTTGPTALAEPSSDTPALMQKPSRNWRSLESSNAHNTTSPGPRLRRTTSVSFID